MVLWGPVGTRSRRLWGGLRAGRMARAWGVAGQWQQRTGRRPRGEEGHEECPSAQGSPPSQGAPLPPAPPAHRPACTLWPRSRGARAGRGGAREWASPGIGHCPRVSVRPRGWGAAGLAAQHTWLWGAGLRGWAPQWSTGPGSPVSPVLATSSPALEWVGGGQESGFEAPLRAPVTRRALTPHPQSGGSETSTEELRQRSASPPRAMWPGAAGPGGTRLRLLPLLGRGPRHLGSEPGACSQCLPGGLSPWGGCRLCLVLTWSSVIVLVSSS